MKQLIFLLPVMLFACNTAIKNDDLAQTDTAIVKAKGINAAKTAYYATTDTVIIASKYFDTLAFSKKEFNDIIDHYPSLYEDLTVPPDIAHAKDIAVATKAISEEDTGELVFNSEAGKDAYYSLYAHFLIQKDSSQVLIRRRDVLNGIYQDVNDMAGELARGGTYFGHQYNRIAAYAEYAVNMFDFDTTSFLKSYDISKQKALFIASLKQRVTDELTLDNDFINANDKEAHKKKIFSYINNIEGQITDGFYLYYAQQFYYNNY